jgi:hypothetical protein
MRYFLKYRPASFCTLPRGVSWQYVEAPHEGCNRPDIPSSKYRHGVITTDRPLTAAEMEQFEIGEAV